MVLWHKRALFSAIIGLIATTGFLVAGFSGTGPAGLEEDSTRRDLAGAFVALGIFGNLIVRYLTRQRTGAARTRVDERDRAIERTAFQISLWLTVAGVFLGCLVLYETHQEAGTISVNWVWFLGFATYILANLGWSVPAVLMYAGVGHRAQG
jgi:hypothetical protein